MTRQTDRSKGEREADIDSPEKVSVCTVYHATHSSVG